MGLGSWGCGGGAGLAAGSACGGVGLGLGVALAGALVDDSACPTLRRSSSLSARCQARSQELTTRWRRSKVKESVAKASPDVQVMVVSIFFTRKALLAVSQSSASTRRVRRRRHSLAASVSTRKRCLESAGLYNSPILGGELGEILRFFVEHDLVNGVDAVLQGVEAGHGLARGGAGSGRFLCVGAAGRGLFGSGLKHGSEILDLRLAGVFGAEGVRRSESAPVWPKKG